MITIKKKKKKAEILAKRYRNRKPHLKVFHLMTWMCVFVYKGDMENSPKLEGMPLSVDVPLYPQKSPFQNGESWQL